jgi:hypothetical protein
MPDGKRVVYDSRFIVAVYYPKDRREAAGIRDELARVCCVANDEHFLKMKELETRWV